MSGRGGHKKQHQVGKVNNYMGPQGGMKSTGQRPGQGELGGVGAGQRFELRYLYIGRGWYKFNNWQKARGWTITTGLLVARNG